MHGVTERVLHALARHWPAVLLAATVIYLLRNRYNKGLNKYPGPFLASLTDWWRFWYVYKRNFEVTHRKLHAKYGDIVRLGPNALSFASPEALKTIYGLNKGFIKVSRCSWSNQPAPTQERLSDRSWWPSSSPTSMSSSSPLSRAQACRRSSARRTTRSTRSSGAASTAPLP